MFRSRINFSHKIKAVLKFLSENIYFICLILILAASFAIRVNNLEYNNPFNDESIYIVLGRLGVFHGDWWTYNANAWMGGSSYIYPAITSIAYVTGGIYGSRVINVILGVLSIEIVFIISTYLSEINNNNKYIIGLISAAIVGASAHSIYISRLATYDMLSFYLLLLGSYCLVISHRKEVNLGKYYFLSAVLLFLSFITKMVTMVLFPLLLIYSIYLIINRNLLKHYFYYWWRLYFWVN